MSADQAKLFDALYFLKMGELKKLCYKLNLSHTGVKGEIIERIKHFVTTGKILEVPEIPSVSHPRKGASYPLASGTLMLMGAYKNDAKTRAFFKKLIGPHFHFTAFGIDWLNARWKAGNPPTYQEFADMWQKEVEKRKHQKPQPKQEWALITFVQKYMEMYPNASKETVMKEWHKIREEKVAIVYSYLKNLS